MKLPDLAPHQAKAVAELDNGKILCGGVGAGKTRVAMRYYIEREAPRNVIVITTAKKRDSYDWQDEAHLHGVGTRPDGTLHGTLTVDSWNNISKYVDVKDAFFILDEQRLVGGGAWVKSFYKIAKANRWILLSATPGDTWLDYIPVFVANGLYPNRTAFLREHVVYNTYSKFPKVDRYIAVGRLVRHRNRLLVDMPFDRHTTRHVMEITVAHDEERFRRVVKDRWHIFENRPLRDVAELFTVMRKTVNTDASRLEAVRSLITRHPRLIVFYNFDYELELLRTLGSESCQDKTQWPTSQTPSTESGQDYPHSGTKHLAEKRRAVELSKKKTSASSSGEHTIPIAEWNRQLRESKSWQTTSANTSQNRYEKNTNCSQIDGHSTPFSEHRGAESKTVTGSTLTANTPRLGSTTAQHSSEEQQPSPASVSIAEWNGHKHEPIPETERWVYLVQYTAGAEGWNCTSTDACVFYSLNYSYRIMEQCMGRIDRMNTPYFDLYYYVLKSKSMIDRAIWAAIKKKKNFQQPTRDVGIWSAEKVFV